MDPVAPVADVIVHQDEGEAFLLHVASGRYFGLNQAGLVVWQALLEGADPVVALARRWPNRDVELLRTDADALMGGLLRAGLVEPAPGPDTPGS